MINNFVVNFLLQDGWGFLLGIKADLKQEII